MPWPETPGPGTGAKTRCPTRPTSRVSRPPSTHDDTTEMGAWMRRGPYRLGTVLRSRILRKCAKKTAIFRGVPVWRFWRSRRLPPGRRTFEPSWLARVGVHDRRKKRQLSGSQTGFRPCGFDTRVVHPFATKQYRRASRAMRLSLGAAGRQCRAGYPGASGVGPRETGGPGPRHGQSLRRARLPSGYEWLKGWEYV